MPHEIRIDGARLALDDVVELGHAGNGPALRLYRLAGGDALFHEECSEVCVTCQACGSPREEVVP